MSAFTDRIVDAEFLCTCNAQDVAHIAWAYIHLEVPATESLSPTQGAMQQSVDCESLTPTEGAMQQRGH